MLMFYSIVFVFCLLIYRKSLVIFITFLLNYKYLSFITYYDFETDMYKYMFISILFTVLVFRRNSIMPLFCIYIYTLLVYIADLISKYY